METTSNLLSQLEAALTNVLSSADPIQRAKIVQLASALHGKPSRAGYAHLLLAIQKGAST